MNIEGRVLGRRGLPAAPFTARARRASLPAAKSARVDPEPTVVVVKVIIQLSYRERPLISIHRPASLSRRVACGACAGASTATAPSTAGHMGDKPWLQPIPQGGGGGGGGDVRCPTCMRCATLHACAALPHMLSHSFLPATH